MLIGIILKKVKGDFFMVNVINEDTTQTTNMEHAEIQIPDLNSEEYLKSMYEES